MRASSQVRKFSTKLLATLALVLTAICGTVNAADEVVFFSVDALGSATAAFNENGDLCWRQTYTPYGQQTNNDDASPPPGCGLIGKDRGYTGHTQDESGLTYMQQRYYDASIGRFLSIDPVGVSPSDPRTYNRYSYAANNPYKYVDPDGQLFFLAAAPLLKAAAVFIVKEAVAEGASRLTGGATDLLTTKGAAKRGFIEARKLFDLNDAQVFISRSASVVKSNKRQGDAYEGLTEGVLKQNGTFAGKQVTFETSTGARSRIDFVVNSKGGKGIVERKSGNGELTSGQRQLFDDVENGRPVTPRGKNAENAGLSPGTPTVLTSCRVDNC